MTDGRVEELDAQMLMTFAAMEVEREVEIVDLPMVCDFSEDISD
ncbi:hypothetical protein A2U01_0097738, partial [Trifolium medium]|nr:hypothetical protein [Trifolium medium]